VALTDADGKALPFLTLNIVDGRKGSN